MAESSVRICGKEHPVIDRIRVGGRLYLVLAKLGTPSRRAYKVFDTSAKQPRALHVLTHSKAAMQHLCSLQRATQGDNEILQILELRREGNDIFIVLPWIDGFNLKSVLEGIRTRNKLRIAAPEAVRLMKGVAHAVSHLHRRPQVVHGDIKPANLILTKRTSLVLIDYGNSWTIDQTIARCEGDGVSHGYAAPEFVRGDRVVNFRADIFSAGVVLYEILTDKLPYDGHGGSVGRLPSKAQSGLKLVPASEISPERDAVSSRIWNAIDTLLARSLSIEAAGRYETTNEWLDAWSSIMEEVHRVKRQPQTSNLLVRLIDWVERRFQ